METHEKFCPSPDGRTKHIRHVNITFTPREYNRLTHEAARFGVSIKAFCRKGVMYAMENANPNVVETK